MYLYSLTRDEKPFLWPKDLHNNKLSAHVPQAFSSSQLMPSTSPPLPCTLVDIFTHAKRHPPQPPSPHHSFIWCKLHAWPGDLSRQEHVSRSITLSNMYVSSPAPQNPPNLQPPSPPTPSNHPTSSNPPPLFDLYHLCLIQLWKWNANTKHNLGHHLSKLKL